MPKYRNSLNVDKDDEDPNITRRTFLTLLGFGAFFGAIQMTFSTIFGFLYPNAMKIPPSVFSLGRPQDVLVAEGRVFIPKQKAFVQVSGGKVRVITAVCTHLGCTVNAVETGYSCPCHGSTYDMDGMNTGGPAPKPLVFFRVSKGAAGDLQVDKTKKIDDPAEAWYSATA